MNFEEFEQKLLKNPKFRKTYEDKTDMRFEISEDIHEARVRAGLTQAQLAKKVGTKQSSIARIESETTLPSLSFLKKIAEALGTSLLAPRFASIEKRGSTTQTYTSFFEEGIYKHEGKITQVMKTHFSGVNTRTKSIKNI